MGEVLKGEALYMVYYPQADNIASELMVAGFQTFLEGNVSDLANATQEVKEFMNIYGESGLNLTGHSRGTMTIGNAMESLEQDGAQGVLFNTSAKFVGAAFNGQQAADLLDSLSKGNVTSIQMQIHQDDFVGTLIGRNEMTYSGRPEESSVIKEWINIFTGTSTAHSCYGAGRDGCGSYGAPVTTDIFSNRVKGTGQ